MDFWQKSEKDCLDRTSWSFISGGRVWKTEIEWVFICSYRVILITVRIELCRMIWDCTAWMRSIWVVLWLCYRERMHNNNGLLVIGPGRRGLPVLILHADHNQYLNDYSVRHFVTSTQHITSIFIDHFAAVQLMTRWDYMRKIVDS